jgi:hypothetical protein
MKTKQALLLFAGLITLTASAQDFKCSDNFKALEDKVIAKAYDEAGVLLPALRKSCPKYSEKLYTYGEKILKFKAERARKPEDEKLLNEDLATLYTEQEKNFPGTGGAAKKAVLLHEQKLADDDEVYKLLDAAFANKQGFTDYNAIELYFNLYLKQFEAGNKNITEEQFIQKYSDIAGQAVFAKNQVAEKSNALLKKQKTETLEPEDALFVKDAAATQSSLDAVSENMALQASKHFNCDKLEAFYSGSYEKNKSNASWLQAMVTALYENKCYKSETLYTGAQALHKLKPAFDSAFMLGNLSLRKNARKEAITYFNEAADMQLDTVKKAETYTTIASTYRNADKAEAKKYALKAIEANGKSGKPYLFLSELYLSASKECSLSAFDKKALTWLAIDTAKKAQVAEPRYKTTVAALIEKTYSKSIPTAADVKAAGKKKGDKITYGCWINETITIPAL